MDKGAPGAYGAPQDPSAPPRYTGNNDPMTAVHAVSQASYPTNQAPSAYPAQAYGQAPPQQQAYGQPTQQGPPAYGYPQPNQPNPYGQNQYPPRPDLPPNPQGTVYAANVSHVDTGATIEQLGGSCIDCFGGPPGVPDDHPLGGFQCSELCHGFFICCGYGQVQHFNGESLDASPCNPGLCYYFPYIGGILGFLMHYPLRQRLENKLVTGSTVGAVMTCPPVDAICTFCFPTCHMCQELRAIRGAMYRSQQSHETDRLITKQ